MSPRKKLAIVDDQPGVTRDRRYASGRLGDLDLELIDTAGFEDVDDESLEARMRIQTELAIEEADVVLFLVDARDGMCPSDQMIAEHLRKRNKATLVVVNALICEASKSVTCEVVMARVALSDKAPICVVVSAGNNVALNDAICAVVKRATAAVLICTNCEVDKALSCSVLKPLTWSELSAATWVVVMACT